MIFFEHARYTYECAIIIVHVFWVYMRLFMCNHSAIARRIQKSHIAVYHRTLSRFWLFGGWLDVVAGIVALLIHGRWRSRDV